MGIFLAVLAALPSVLELILAAERIFMGDGKGALKKESVMQGVQAGLTVASAAGAKLSAEEQGAIVQGIGQSVDGFVKVLNTAGWPAEKDHSAA